MKTKYWILLLAGLLLVCLGLSLPLLLPGEGSPFAEIHSDGQLVKTVDLRLDQQFTVITPSGGINVITVRDGKIAVTEASCPDHYCMQRGYCSGGAQIVCLPNRLIIRFGENREIDGIVE